MTTTDMKMLFTTKEVAEICEVSAQTLRDWIAEGMIVPAVAGGKGRGCSHRFTAQQVLGIAVAVALWDSPRGCRRGYFAATAAHYNDWQWTALEHVLGLRKDEWSAEEFAKAVGPRSESLTADRLLPEDVEMVRRMVRMMERARDAIRERLLEQEERKERALRRTRERTERQAAKARKCVVDGRKRGV
ncbi:MAG: MerR family transcriptional regulator [Planctomycetes bacterium]|nr:MerR family transcriptional regulator [Planctomycetota bacterium]